jgi:hypothetical protein
MNKKEKRYKSNRLSYVINFGGKLNLNRMGAVVPMCCLCHFPCRRRDASAMSKLSDRDKFMEDV